MKMVFKLDTKKIIKNNEFSIEEIYHKLDCIMKKNHITKKDSSGNYIGPDNNDYYIHFGKAFMELVDCEWFLKYASKCYWHVFGNVEDVLKAFNEYHEKKYA